MYKMCICIPTLNRVQYIGETLDSIVPQLQDGDVEMVIVDGGSNDGTEALVAGYAKKFPVIRYVKREKSADAPSNAGFDRDCSYAVELANAEYCWLMTDDDIVQPGAIRKILAHLEAGHDLVVASCEIRDVLLRTTLVDSRPGLSEDRVFQPGDWEEFCRRSVVHLTFVGAVIVKRSLWLERHPESFFGSGLVHVGVIFSAPVQGSVLIIAEPLVVIRYGNAMWSKRGFEIFMLQWPELIWSLRGIQDAAKQSITPRDPWRLWRVLLLQRAYGRYSLVEYRTYLQRRFSSPMQRGTARLIALIPQWLLYGPAWVYGRLLHPHPRYFIATLKEGMRR